MRKSDNTFNDEYKSSIGKFNIKHSLAVYGACIFLVFSLVSYTANYIYVGQLRICIH